MCTCASRAVHNDAAVTQHFKLYRNFCLNDENALTGLDTFVCKREVDCILKCNTMTSCTATVVVKQLIRNELACYIVKNATLRIVSGSQTRHCSVSGKCPDRRHVTAVFLVSVIVDTSLQYFW